MLKKRKTKSMWSIFNELYHWVDCGSAVIWSSLLGKDQKIETLLGAVLISINFATFVTQLLPLSRGRCVDYQVILIY